MAILNGKKILFSPNVHISGINHEVGCKGYEIYKVDTAKKYIVTTYPIAQTDWEVGDRVAFDIGKTYTYGFTIKSFVHKAGYTTIYINEALPASNNENGDTMYIWNLDKPLSGDIDIGINAFNQGIDTVAIGKGAVALNRETKAEGNFSLAANRGTIAGYGAAAFGKATEALGSHSFTSGIGTIANSDYQRVEGKFNIEDTEGKYACIVGGGSRDTDRKNIYTLDWEGNGAFAGSITIGNTTLTEEQLKKLIALIT
jgi:hypothetical protein